MSTILKTTQKIGNSILDLPDGAETSATRANRLQSETIQNKFNTDFAKYETDFKLAQVKAEDASKLIGGARCKRNIVIACLVGTICSGIILTVGTIVAGALMGVGALGVGALVTVPFFLGIIPAAIFTHKFRVRCNELDADTHATESIVKPTLTLPTYRSELDLELKESRLKLQKEVRSMKLDQIHKLGFVFSDIADFALLHSCTRKKLRNYSPFYEKCRTLFSNIDTLTHERNQHLKRLQDEYNRKTETLQREERDAIPSVTFHRDVFEAENHQRLSRALRQMYIYRAQENKSWHDTTKTKILADFKDAVEKINEKFQKLKQSFKSK